MKKKDKICVITLSDSESESDKEKSINIEDKNETNNNEGNIDIVTLDESSDVITLDDSSLVEPSPLYKIDRTGSSTLPDFIPVPSPPRCRKKKMTFSNLREEKARKQRLREIDENDETQTEKMNESIIIVHDITDSSLTEADNSVKLVTSTEREVTSTDRRIMVPTFRKVMKRLKKRYKRTETTQNTEQNAPKIAKRKLETPCESIVEKKLKTTISKPKNRIIQLDQSNASIPKICTKGLRPIIIDGLNVARGHGLGSFSFEGIVIIVRYFESRGHKEIVCFLPQHYRSQIDYDSQLGKIKLKYEKARTITYTPSRIINGKRISPYDDRYIVQYAAERKGVIISNDNYRDLLMEADWRETIENRIVNFTFTKGGGLMLPRDPLGSDGPTLDEVLRFPNNSQV